MTGRILQLKPQVCLLGCGLAEESALAEDHVLPLGVSHFAWVLLHTARARDAQDA
jgi:hypothetical protein